MPEALLRPQLNAGLEAAQQSYETTRLAKEQEIENLAASLEKGIEAQNRAYRQSVADVETAALARGMGREQLHAAKPGEPGGRAGQSGAAADG